MHRSLENLSYMAPTFTFHLKNVDVYEVLQVFKAGCNIEAAVVLFLCKSVSAKSLIYFPLMRTNHVFIHSLCSVPVLSVFFPSDAGQSGFNSAFGPEQIHLSD